MKIQYKIDRIDHNIFYKKNIDNSIISEIEKIKSDKKILFIYDGKIQQKIVEQLFRKLKNSGCDVSAYEFKGNIVKFNNFGCRNFRKSILAIKIKSYCAKNFFTTMFFYKEIN